ncbi:MAG: hypothetical protein D6772_07610 [Bacteroidetes bacterium]|nr:MAG: hypothetical protein D6772_07610 [Bacteroidota bacterium]
MRTIALLLIFACFTTMSVSAQSEETLFSNSHLDLSGAWGSATYNFSSFGDDWTLIRGGYGGIEFNRDIFIGYGRYETRERAIIDQGTKEFGMNYNGLLLGIAPNSIRAIHPRFTFLTGSGRVWTKEDDERERVFVFQPSAGVEFNVFQWFRVGFEAGYRFTGDSKRHELTSGDLSTPFAQIELRFGLSWGD